MDFVKILAHLIIIGFAGISWNCKSSPSKQKLRIGFSQCCYAPWRTIMENEMKREMAFYPEAELIIKVGENSQNQIRQIKEFIKEGVDVLMVAPFEAEPLTPIAEEVFKSGIPLIMLDRETNSDQYSAYIGADNYEIGKTACQYIADKLKEKANIVEVQINMATSPGILRSKGFIDALKDHPGMKIIKTISNPSDQPGIISSILNETPEIDVFFCHSDLVGIAVSEQLRRLNLQKVPMIIGIDGLPGKHGGIQMVENGVLTATLLYPTGGTEAIQKAVAITQNLPVNKRNILHTAVIDKANARTVNFQMEKVLSLQESISQQLKFNHKLKTTYQNLKLFITILILSLLLSLALGIGFWRSLVAKKIINKSLETKNKEIIHQQEQLVAMAEQLSIVTKAKMDFFTNISHEFKTPLSLILGFAEDLIPSPKFSKETHQSLSQIKENAYRLLRLVNQLMDFRKVDEERMAIQVREGDLVAFLYNIVQAYQSTARKRSIDLQFHSQDQSLIIWFDHNIMDKVIFNLLSNAFKFTNEGGKISLFVSTDKLQDHVVIKIEDTGEGMNENTLNNIFNPFYQAHPQSGVGTGLGLPLSLKLIKLHHGDIQVHSIQGKGSRFTVLIPWHKHQYTSQEITPESEFIHESNIHISELESISFSSPVPNDEAGDHKPHLLIIEDNKSLQFLLHKKLDDYYDIFQALDGESGLESALSNIPDIIICDEMMPMMSGLEVVRTLKSDLRTCHIPILLVTAQDSMDHRIAGEKSGADAYFTKPFNIQLLKEKMNNLLLNREILKNHFSDHGLNYSSQVTDGLSPLDIHFLDHFTKFIETNFNREDLNVVELAREMKLSRSQLYRKVKALLGISLTEYIKQVRLKKAEELLQNCDLSVSEIAYQTGYSSPEYFSTVFRLKHGVAPLQYRSGQKVPL